MRRAATGRPAYQPAPTAAQTAAPKAVASVAVDPHRLPKDVGEDAAERRACREPAGGRDGLRPSPRDALDLLHVGPNGVGGVLQSGAKKSTPVDPGSHQRRGEEQPTPPWAEVRRVGLARPQEGQRAGTSHRRPRRGAVKRPHGIGTAAEYERGQPRHRAARIGRPAFDHPTVINHVRAGPGAAFGVEHGSVEHHLDGRRAAGEHARRSRARRRPCQATRIPCRGRRRPPASPSPAPSRGPPAATPPRPPTPAPRARAGGRGETPGGQEDRSPTRAFGDRQGR